jgi:hypothetical protein
MQDKNDTEALWQQLEVLKENDTTVKTLHQKLSSLINDLVNTDFGKLVQLLYRLDIDEKKLKKILQEYPGRDAGEMIAELIIERQLQKIRSRRQFSQRDNNIDENDKW